MVKVYVNLIIKGKMTLDQVPKKWRAAVEEELSKQQFAVNSQAAEGV